jgi:hypothetical protein
MRTTLALDDALVEKVKKIAVERNATLTAVIEDLLRVGLAARNTAKKRERRPLPIFRGNGVAPGVDLDRTGAHLAAEDEANYRASR